MYGFVLVFCSNFALKRFLRYSTSIMPWPWKRVTGPSRSLEMYPFDGVHTTSYAHSIVSMPLSCRFWEIQSLKMSWPWNRVTDHSRSLKVVPFDRLFGFLLEFFSNIVHKKQHFWDIRLQNAVTLKTELGVRRGHWKYHHSVERIRLPMMFHSNYSSILCPFWYIQCRKMSWPWNRG